MIRKRQIDKRKKKNKVGKMGERKGRDSKKFEGEENKTSTMVGRNKVLMVALSNTHTVGCSFLTMFSKL